jgi:hypothetical protein
LALTSPTGGGLSVGIVRSRTKATEFFLIIIHILYTECAKIKKIIPAPKGSLRKH